MSVLTDRQAKIDYAVGAALLVLLALSAILGLAVDLGPAGPAVGLTISAAKALLVALVFMRLRTATPAVRLFAAAALFWVLIMFTITLADYFTRAGWPA